MKKIFILISALILSQGIFSQTDSTSNEDEEVGITIGGKKIIIRTSEDGELIKINTEDLDSIEKKSCKPKYPNIDVSTSLDLGVSGLLYKKNTATTTTPLSTLTPDMNYGKNRHYGFNIHLAFNFTKNIGILTGIGYNCNKYTFKNNLTIDPEDGNFMTDSTNSYNYFEFQNNYWQIPLMLKFQTSNGKLQFAAGGIVGYNSSSEVQYEYVEGNTEYETTISGNFNVNPIKLSLGARLNYNEIGVFFNYALSNFNDKTYLGSAENFDFMPFSAGITLGGF